MSEHLNAAITKDRQYVGNKETISYIVFDASESVHAGVFGSRYNIDLLKINLNLFSIISLINGFWDIVNDTFTGPIVDKTRTRWGKFKPYLIAFAIPSLVVTALQWSLPFFLDTEDEYDMTKFFFYLAIAMTNEAMGTFRNISKTGLLSSMTPNPAERAKLLALAKWISSILDNIPGVVLSVIYDLMNNNIIHIRNKRMFYGGIAVGASFISTCMAMFFFVTAQERVIQSEKTPSVMEGFRTIVRNRPVFLLMLSDLLGAFTLSTTQDNYFIDVLGFHHHFSRWWKFRPSRFVISVTPTSTGCDGGSPHGFLWALSSNFDNLQRLLTFGLGCIGGTGPGGWYRDWKKMLAIMIPLDIARKSFWGVRNVVPQEVTYESIDYCEWKNGYRSEGVIVITRSLMSKIVRNTTSGLQAAILSAIGYSLKKGSAIRPTPPSSGCLPRRSCSRASPARSASSQNSFTNLQARKRGYVPRLDGARYSQERQRVHGPTMPMNRRVCKQSSPVAAKKYIEVINLEPNTQKVEAKQNARTRGTAMVTAAMSVAEKPPDMY
jgi:Na+/melibiose symporter-like transporter